MGSPWPGRTLVSLSRPLCGAAYQVQELYTVSQGFCFPGHQPSSTVVAVVQLSSTHPVSSSRMFCAHHPFVTTTNLGSVLHWLCCVAVIKGWLSRQNEEGILSFLSLVELVPERGARWEKSFAAGAG